MSLALRHLCTSVIDGSVLHNKELFRSLASAKTEFEIEK